MMNEHDRHRSQDPDDDFSTRDEMTSMGDDEAMMMGEGMHSPRQGGEDDMASGMRGRRSMSGGKHARQEDDLYGSHPEEMDDENW